MTEAEIFVGIALTIGLGVGCQVMARRLQLPAIVLLLPAGFAAGAIVSFYDPAEVLGPFFSPLVEVSVAVILFDAGLDLRFRDLEGHSQRVVRRLLALGVPITWIGAALFSALFLGLSVEAAAMLGAILIVSGPTVIAPLLRFVSPGERVSTILGWESSTIDPIGAIIAAVVFQGLTSGATRRFAHGVAHLAGDFGVGLIGAAIGTALLWILLRRMALKGVLSTEATLATVVVVASLCDALRANSGLIAAIGMGVALTNLPNIEPPNDRPFFKTIVELVIAVLFVSISATVTPASVGDVLLPTLGLVASLVLVVRPVVVAVSTVHTDLSLRERALIGWMDPRGIVAASTAATFSSQLIASGVDRAERLLPITFLVIVATVTIYGLSAAPLARALGLAGPAGRPQSVEPRDPGL